MSLTDPERAEFLRLTQNTYDPEIWLEDDLPLLRQAEKEHLEAQRRERESSKPETLAVNPNDDPGVSPD